MAGSYTEHYQLSQWQPQDRVLRTEFNQDNAKLDGAIAAAVPAGRRTPWGTPAARLQTRCPSRTAQAEASWAQCISTRLRPMKTVRPTMPCAISCGCKEKRELPVGELPFMPLR